METAERPSRGNDSLIQSYSLGRRFFIFYVQGPPGAEGAFRSLMPKVLDGYA